MRRISVIFTVLAVLAFGARAARSHEGHDDAPGGGTAAVSSRHVLIATSDRYELVLKNDALRPGMKTDLEVYLSEFQTNAPIAEAAITLSLRSGSRERGMASPDRSTSGRACTPPRFRRLRIRGASTCS